MTTLLAQQLELPKSYKVYAFSLSITSQSLLLGQPLWILRNMLMTTHPQMKKIFYIHEKSSLGKDHIHGVLVSQKVISYKALNATYAGVNIYLRRMVHYPPLSYVTAETVKTTPRHMLTWEMKRHLAGWLVYMVKTKPHTVQKLEKRYDRNLKKYVLRLTMDHHVF